MTRSDVNFEGKTALIAGASGALGSRIAERLAAGGADLTLVGKRSEALEDAAPSAQANKVDRIVSDLRDPAAAEHVVQATVDRTGQLDLVVNAVGVVAFGNVCLLYTSPSPRDGLLSRMPSSA